MKLMKPILVALTGVINSGKDTSADYLVSELNKKGIRSIKIGFADRLKIICQRLVELFYDIDIPIENFYDRMKKEEIVENFPKFGGQPFKLRTILQRVGTEIFRDLLWDDIWCDYINKIQLINHYDVIIVSDWRFPNEIEYFEKLEDNGQLLDVIKVRINRDHTNDHHIKTLKMISNIIHDYKNNPNDINIVDIIDDVITINTQPVKYETTHISEKYISQMQVQYEIYNNSSLSELYHNLDTTIISKIDTLIKKNECQKKH
jgi:hypothetical protein